MAQDEPETKKFKHSIISDHVYSESFKELFATHWHASSDMKKDNLEVISKPFKVCRISNFIKNEYYMDEIKNELVDVKSRRNSIDLYQFEQTVDFANIDSTFLKCLYETFETDLTLWMEENTKIKLNHKISMSSSCYSDTDYLLCHDDNMGDRRIAFVLYLSQNWTAEDGGALDLFDTDENGLPNKVVRSLLPEYNSLVFFEVVDNSYHQVAEVVSPNKSRWSINGWFHGPVRKSNKPPRPAIMPVYVEPTRKAVNLKKWIRNCYLCEYIVKEIQEDVEQESYAFLSNFFTDDVYDRLRTDIKSDRISWKTVGPADLRNYEVADERTLPIIWKELCNIMRSEAIFRLLREYTDLDLAPDNDELPKMTMELQRWTKGCYTLICDRVDKSTSDTDDKKKGASHCSNAGKDSGEPQTSKVFKTAVNVKEQVCTSSDKKNASPCASHMNTQEDEDLKQDDQVKKIGKNKSPKSNKKANSMQQSSVSDMESLSPQKITRNLDTDDSDVSDIGDYLSDPLDCSLECSDQEEEEEDEIGALDVIMQFHTEHLPEEDTICYVDPKEQEGVLIQVPAKDNHLCLVYNTLSIYRVHKYVNHYCKDYYYNLICTYFE